MKENNFFKCVDGLTIEELALIFHAFGYDFNEWKENKIKNLKNSDKSNAYAIPYGLLAYWYLVYEKRKNSKIVDLVINDTIKKTRGY